MPMFDSFRQSSHLAALACPGIWHTLQANYTREPCSVRGAGEAVVGATETLSKQVLAVLDLRPARLPSTLKLGMLAKQNNSWGDLSLGAWEVQWAMLLGTSFIFGR
eukprot:470360-Pelagomonas_calceolata.AAC.1